MAAGKVGQYSIGAFAHPANGEDLDATVVMGNDNTIGTTYNEHDADPTIHVQSSTLAQRPAAGTAQRVYVTTDGYRIYLDTGTAWQELAYLSSAGGTLTGDLLFTDNLYDIGKSGATRPRDGFFARNVSVASALSAATLATSSTASFGGAVTVSAGGLSVAGGVTVSGAGVSIASGGLSVTGGITFGADAAYDIGAPGASRPRNIYVAGAATLGGTTTVGGSFVLGGNQIAQCGAILFNSDNTSDIGASGANRPRNVWVGSGINAAGSITAVSGFFSGGAILFSSDNTADIGASGANRPRNIYAAGSIFSASSRALKEQIRPTRVDALALIRKTRVVDFRYRANPSRAKIGFIAEDTDELLSGPAHKDFDLNNAIGVLLRAVQQLDERIAMAA